MIQVRIKRVYEDFSETDGYRVLVDKLWPRGMKKEWLKYDYWAKDITPSSTLRRWFHEDIPGHWEDFVIQYQKELDASVPLLEQGYFIDNNQLPVTANFALTPDGVIFYYNVYEIAPYAYGPSQVTVPYADLKDIMVYKPDFSGSEVFPVESAS